MNTPVRLACVLASVAFGLAACREAPQAQLATPTDWWLTTNSPAIEFWDAGHPMIRLAPWVIFAVWSDGLFVRTVDGQLRQGQLSQSEIRKLMTEVEAAGFFSPFGSYLLDSYGLSRPDGPLRCIAAARHGTVVRRYFDDFDDFQSVGPRADPSRGQMEAFARMWHRTVRAIEAVPGHEVRPFCGDRPLRYPKG